MSTVLHASDSNFDDLLTSEGPVLIDFTATWCGPCRMISPLIEQLATDYEGRAKIAKLDVDESRDIAKRFEIKSIPAVLIFKGGSVVERIIGAVPYQTFTNTLDRHI